MQPFPTIALLRMCPKSANEIPRSSSEEHSLALDPRPPRPCGSGLPGLAPMTARGPGTWPPTPFG
jgi:hypothetical protein